MRLLMETTEKWDQDITEEDRSRRARTPASAPTHVNMQMAEISGKKK